MSRFLFVKISGRQLYAHFMRYRFFLLVLDRGKSNIY